MTASLTKTFPTYRDATLWLYDRGFRGAAMKQKADGQWTVTVKGGEAIRAIEEAAGAKVVPSAS